MVIAIIGLLIAILLPALKHARKAAKQTMCMNTMSQHGKSMVSYASDFKDALFSTSWRKARTSNTIEGSPQVDADLANVADDLEAAASQAVQIIRRQSNDTTFPRQPNWLPNIYYSHLVLQDYARVQLPDPNALCPEDADRKRWAADPKNWQATGASLQRLPYSSSYQWVPAIWTPDRFTSDGGYLRQGPTHSTFTYYWGNNNQYRMGQRTMNAISFPSLKVALYDEYDRHTTSEIAPFFTHQRAKPPCMYLDGSVRLTPTVEVNPGGYQGPPGQQNTAVFINYDFASSQVPIRWPDNSSTNQPARYRFTLGGLKGVDVKGTSPFTIP